MIPYDTDPSLHDAQPTPPVLGDGFSPPQAPQDATGWGERPDRRDGSASPQPAQSQF